MFLVLDFTQSLRLSLINKNQYFSKELKSKKNISEILILEIDKFLKKSKTNIKKIKSIVVITGPGSFTGIRSALTYAKSLKLIAKLNVFGLSKFEIINSKIKKSKLNKNQCIFLHFKDNQFFTQSFIGFKATGEVKLINLDNEGLKYNNQTTYIYDDILFEENLNNNIKEDLGKNLLLIDYNLIELEQIILKNTIDCSDPKPLYISNYY